MDHRERKDALPAAICASALEFGAPGLSLGTAFIALFRLASVGGEMYTPVVVGTEDGGRGLVLEVTGASGGGGGGTTRFSGVSGVDSFEPIGWTTR